MTTAEFIGKLRENGFSARQNWQAKKSGESKVSVSEWFVYHETHGLLTSCIVNAFGDDGLAVYWCNEKNTSESDIDYLNGIIAKREARAA